MLNKGKGRRPAMTMVALLATTGLGSAVAYAQDAPPPATSSDVAEIVVTGIRGSLQRALDIKRDAPTVVDAISAEDVGKFPDLNVAESVQRISGVQINRLRGEGQSVNIRGLPATFTLATLNGRTVANAIGLSGSRAFDFQTLPPEFINALEVYKAPTADMDEGGLSGTVNIRTPHALSMNQRVISGSARFEYDDNSGAFSPQLAAMFADKFLDDRLGIVAGVSYLKRNFEPHSFYQTYITGTEKAPSGKAAGVDVNGDGKFEDGLTVRTPSAADYGISPVQNERLSAIGSIELQASDALRIYADGMYSRLDSTATDFETVFIFGQSKNRTSASAQTLEGLSTVTQLRVSDLDVRYNGRVQERSGYLWNAVAGAHYEADRFSANVEYARSKSTQTSSGLVLANKAGVPIDAAVNTTTKNLSSVTYFGNTAASLTDPNLFQILSINGSFNQKARDVASDGKIDLAYDFGDQGLTRLSFGGKLSKYSKYVDSPALTITAPAIAKLWKDKTGSDLPTVPGSKPAVTSAGMFMIPVVPGQGSFLGSYGGDATFPQSWFGTKLSNFTDKFTDEELIAAGKYEQEPTKIINVEERITALYGRADFAFGQLDGNVGLRWVRTKQRSIGVETDFNNIKYFPKSGNVTTTGAGSPLVVDRSYSNFLPSFNLRFRPADDITLRLAASRTIARPNYDQISSTVNVNVFRATVTEQNPYLDPFIADNLDLTAEWYFRPSSLLGVSLFYKNLKSLIRPTTKDEVLPFIEVDGSAKETAKEQNFTFSSLANGSGVKLKGVEFNFQTNLDFIGSAFLKNFGVQFNYTFIDNSDPQQLTAASKHNLNATGFYESGPLGIRLSYSWRDKFLTLPSVSPTMGRITQAYGTLDGSINFKVNENISMVLQAVNILDEDEVDLYTTGLPANYLDAGRRVQGGIRLRF